MRYAVSVFKQFVVMPFEKEMSEHWEHFHFATLEEAEVFAKSLPEGKRHFIEDLDNLPF